MYNLIKPLYLKLLRVPPEPNDPFGEEDSVRVFRAAPNFLKYRLILWGIGMLFIGSILVVVALGLHLFGFAEGGGAGVFLNLIALLVWCFLAFIALFTYIGTRLDYEMRWYKVSDRALRIREGVWAVREMTMTFANIQNLSITQGPIQRYLNICDLKVQTAGGGGIIAPQQQGIEPSQFQMHIGYFRGVNNAEEIRNLIQQRLRLLRDTGLGNTDEHDQEHEPGEVGGATAAPMSVSGDVLAELRALCGEAKAFRAAAEGR